ncbi:hypothetical protein ID866_5488, partial [Astraeus odoratus]
PLGYPKTFLRNWGPSLGVWGFGAGTAALFVLECFYFPSTLILLIRALSAPQIGDYFEDKTPASDKPF